jgi:plasmid stabilization system protein ParE
MKYSIIIRPEAETDLAEAFLWYEDKRRGLGHDFLLQVEAGLKFIERSPEIHNAGYKGTRTHLIKRFPYKIIYMFAHEKVVVIALLHGRRSPELLKKRISSS